MANLRLARAPQGMSLGFLIKIYSTARLSRFLFQYRNLHRCRERAARSCVERIVDDPRGVIATPVWHRYEGLSKSGFWSRDCRIPRLTAADEVAEGRLGLVALGADGIFKGQCRFFTGSQTRGLLFMVHHGRRTSYAPLSGRALMTLSAAVVLSLSAMSVGTPAFAQKKDAAKKEEAKKPAAEHQSAWVKLCEVAKLNKPTTKPGDKPEVEEKKICLTHHERLDGNTGMVLVSAAIREVEGQDKKSLMIMVPLGMAIPPGVRAAVYSTDQWEKAAKNEQIDEKQLKPINLKYSLCHPAGCTAEIEADAGLIDQMKKGGGLMILALNAAAKPVGFPVPLDGFTKAFEGPPIDNEKYAQARSQLMNQIRERQAKMIEKMKEEQKARADAAKLLDPPPGSDKKKK